jgi:uncharacterized membrane protein YphA (DoxX/SURF4 family)
MSLLIRQIKLSDVGRIFYGMAMAGMGFQTIYDHDLPYMLIPPGHSWISNLTSLAYISGIMLVVAGTSIVFKIKPRPIALLLGFVLLLIFCFYFIPYEFLFTPNYMHLGEWDNAEKELALSSGALLIAGSFPKTNENFLFKSLSKLIPLGVILFSITILSFGIDHFLYAKDVADYIPSWIPNRIFWAYFAGTALICSGIAIILKTKLRLGAALLGTMIFIWVIILHIPKVINASGDERKGELTSAFLALAYSGIAFVIAGLAKNNRSIK